MGHIDSYKKWGTKQAKKLEEDQMVMGQNPVPQEFQAESDALTQEEANLLKQLANVKERKMALDKKISEANKKKADAAAQLAQQQATDAQQVANQA